MSTRGPWDVRTDRGVRVDALHGGGPVPVVQHPRSAGLTYEPYYGLTEQPFSISSNPAFFYQSQSHASAFQELLAGIRRRERLSVLTGDIGTGKTTLCRAVLQNLDRETFSAFVPDPFASREDLLKVLLMDFGVMSLDDLTSGRLKTASRTELSYLLYDFLAKLAPLQAFAVVVIDEAQNLSLPLLEEIRILSDADGRDRQLQVVLVGQLELRQQLKLPGMRQVDQRVSVRSHLEPLKGDSVAGYVAHRLRVAGASPDRVSFAPDACEVVYQASRGVPRLINRICDRALNQGYLLRAAVINPDMVRTAVGELGESVPGFDPVAASVPVSTAAPAPPERPAADTEPADPIPDWLAIADAAEANAAARATQDRPGAARRAASAAQHGQSISLPKPVHREERRPQPTTHMERMTQRFLWAAGVVAIFLMAPGVLALGGVVLEKVSADPDVATPLPALPSNRPLTPPIAFAPPVPPETTIVDGPAVRTYVIEVARFQTPQGATWVTADLTKAGFRAYAAQLDVAGVVRHQVVVGPYGTRAEAESDLQRLHQMGGYEDARLTR